jgi:hypothetical protein
VLDGIASLHDATAYLNLENELIQRRRQLPDMFSIWVCDHFVPAFAAWKT